MVVRYAIVLLLSDLGLIVIHTGPGSVLEFRKMTPLLLNPSTDNAPAFHVVAPSLPGYGFSEAPKKTGFGPKEMGDVSHLTCRFRLPPTDYTHIYE